MSALLWILLAASCNTGALALLKLAGGGIRYQEGTLSVGAWHLAYLLAGLLCYGVAFLLTVRILSLSAFVVAVPVFVAFQFVLTSLLAIFLFGEPLTLQGWLGVVVVLAGVALLVTGGK